MGVRLPLLVVAMLVPSLSAGQTTADDGIRALVRGDYQLAVRILRPVAEDATAPDPVAQFFMAVLYQSGRGVAPDSLRACGLFAGAAKTASPFMQQASELANAMRDQMGLGAQFCGSPGPWTNPVPASFTLGPNHQVDITGSSITVRYHGAERRVTTPGGPGLVYLAPRYTSLQISRPVAAQRYFIEQFVWSPNAPEKPSTWTLGWTLAEIVGADYVPTTGERNLISLAGTEAPVSFNVAIFADVRVKGYDAVEFRVGGRNPRSGLIPRRDPQ
jgi:hypothetical protein